MAHTQLVRVGPFGRVGCFATSDGTCYPRDCRVVLRTDRGLELGQVLSPGEPRHRRLTDGTILRGMTSADELLETRLKRHQQQAVEACSRRIAELGLSCVLMDAELLFDGRSLYFYFLGPEPPELQGTLDELAELYEAQAQVRRFADTLTTGCGPDCGTAAAAGSGCTHCGAGCAVAGLCGTRDQLHSH